MASDRSEGIVRDGVADELANPSDGPQRQIGLGPHPADQIGITHRLAPKGGGCHPGAGQVGLYFITEGL